MVKKTIAILFCIMILLNSFSVLSQGASLPEDEIFYKAKEALKLMSEKHFGKAIAALNAEAWLKTADLKKTIERSCKQLYKIKVQEKYAVAWYKNGVLYMAIPLEEPSDGYVDAIVMTLNNRFDFVSLDFSKWSEVENDLKTAASIKWCEEYIPTYKIFID